ncbi:MAG: DUF177 domain-containing protein [Myxococcales bacterium]|nr:DUF177 domain-containing protein [Myxococcales bacterium]
MAQGTERDDLRYRVRDIEMGGETLDLDLSAPLVRELLADSESSYRVRDASLKGTLNLSKHDEMVFVKGGFRVPMQYECCRCLSEVDEDIDIRLAWSFLPVSKYKAQETPEEIELTEEDADVSFYSGDSIDLADVIREAILLEQDAFPTCSMGCEPPAAGDRSDGFERAEGDVDPRWAPLAALKNKQNS